MSALRYRALGQQQATGRSHLAVCGMKREGATQVRGARNEDKMDLYLHHLLVPRCRNKSCPLCPFGKADTGNLSQSEEGAIITRHTCLPLPLGRFCGSYPAVRNEASGGARRNRETNAPRFSSGEWEPRGAPNLLTGDGETERLSQVADSFPGHVLTRVL